MGKRLDLHAKLLTFMSNVYYQPPSTIQMKYPCITYNKNNKSNLVANDGLYLSTQGYQIMVIEKDPDSNVADLIESGFQHCSIEQYYTVDNLNHTTLSLFY